MTLPTLTVANLGRTSYAGCWDLQKNLSHARQSGGRGDMLLLTEHEHVYTLGKGANDDHLLAGDDELRATGAEVFHIDRGGDITYHGPGQIVGYPILDLRNHKEDLHWYLRSLEETIIRTLSQFGIEGGREEGMTGVWVKGEKIAAIGVKVSRWITMHGFALNVSTDLSRFDRIIPCGIFHKGVTSMERVTGSRVAMEEVRTAIVEAFAGVFTLSPVKREELLMAPAETHVTDPVAAGQA